MIKYGLKHIPTKTLIGIEISLGHGEYGTEIVYELINDTEHVWLIDSMETAQKVANSAGHGQSHASPLNDFIGDLEAVRLNIFNN